MRVKDSYEFEEHKEAVEAYLGLTDEDTGGILCLLFDSSVDVIDEYLNNPFLDDEGCDTGIPTAITLAIYMMVKHELDSQSRENGVTEVKTGDLKVKYSGMGSQGIPESISSRIDGWRCIELGFLWADIPGQDPGQSLVYKARELDDDYPLK
jgi:hypothetical protein